MTLPNRLISSAQRLARSTLVSALLSFLTILPAGEAAAQQARTVTVGLAERNTVVDQIAVVGTLMAKEEITINALVQGKEVRKILVEVGAKVAKGQALAVLDEDEARLSLDRNNVQFTRASAAVAQEHTRVEVAAITEQETRKVVERSRSLMGKGAVSQQVLDEHENAFSRARSQLELARKSLILAESDRELVERDRAEIVLKIERSTVRAKEAGTILSRSARVGTTTASSADPLFVLAKDGLIEMEATVSEASFVRLKQGMRAAISIPGSNRSVVGEVRLIAAQIDPATRMGTVRIELDQSNPFVPGAFVHGRIEVAKRLNVTVPATAVRIQNGAVSVIVVVNERAVPRAVTLGSYIGSQVEILSGLEEGEHVVTKAGSFLKPDESIVAIVVPGLTMDELSAGNLVRSIAR